MDFQLCWFTSKKNDQVGFKILLYAMFILNIFYNWGQELERRMY